MLLSRTLSAKKFHFLFHIPKVNPCELWASPFQALFSTHIVGDKPVLVRDFIHSALYDPKHGYFSQRSSSVGVLQNSIRFNRIEGRKAYMKYLDKIYKESEVSWFTPVEIFKPWYAHGIAEAILRTANFSVPLKIYEIGGGSGTCAKGIMDYIMLNAPSRVYNSMTYTSVEISPSLAEIQRETVGEVRTHLSKFRVECRDAADRRGWGDAEQQPCWVIMLEVLDNLPHDLIYSENQVSPWMEVWVEKQQDGGALSELYKPMQDSLIKRCVEIINLDKNHDSQSRAILKAKRIWSKVFPKPRRCWLPTGCLKLLEVLHGALPKMSLIASDFNYLPDVKILGERAPLVSTKKDGSSSDYSSYLDARGDADIFFPTEFWLLERIDHYCSGWLKLQKDLSSKEGKKRRTIILSYIETVDADQLDEEFDSFPTSRSAEVVRMRYDRLRSVAGEIQTVVGYMASQGERFQALLSWRDPRATFLFVIFCFVAAVALYAVPLKVVVALWGLYLLRPPILRNKLPSRPLSFFRRLPTRDDILF